MSSKKKSKSKNKLARMSEEDRMRYMQHRAAMEEEAHRRKQQLIATYLKDKLKHEDAFSRLNTAKINQQWRNTLRQIKCTELRDDMQSLKQRFEMVLDCKNKIIENLLSDFDDSEIQYCMQFQKHIEMISKFIGLHQIRLKHLHEWYLTELDTIMKRRNVEKGKTVKEIMKDTNILKQTCHATEDESKKKIVQMKTEFTGKETDLKHSLLYNMNEMEETYHEKFNILQREFAKLLQDYKQETEQNSCHYNVLWDKDKADSVKVLKHADTIAKYTEKINKLKIQCGKLEHEYKTETEKLKTRQSFLTSEFHRLTKKLEDEKTLDQQQLTLLTTVSNCVIQDLEDVLTKGEKILQIVNSCNKLSATSESKIFPEINNDIDEVNHTVSSLPYEKLEYFWRRHNQLQLDYEQLKSERKTALTENRQLKKLLRQRLTSIRRPSSVPRKSGY